MPESHRVIPFRDRRDRAGLRQQGEINETRTRLLNAAAYLLAAATIPESQDPIGVRAVERAARLTMIQPRGRVLKITELPTTLLCANQLPDGQVWAWVSGYRIQEAGAVRRFKR